MILYQMIKAAIAAVAIHNLHPVQPLSPGMQAFELKRTDRATVVRARFNTLVKQGKFDEAENSLKELGGYVAPLDLARQSAELNLSKSDYTSALSDLKLFFDGTATESRAVTGATEERAWYWFLLTQKGQTQKATEELQKLFSLQVRSPMGGPFLEPETLSRIPLAQVYMYLAGYYSRTTNYYRSDKCIELARKVDPSVKVDPGFEKIATMYGYEKGVKGKQESYATIPMLDHLAYANVTKLKVKIQ